MSISYNPDRTPHSDPSLFDEARAEGMQVIEVICEEEGARAGDPTGLSFAAIVPFLPDAARDSIALDRCCLSPFTPERQ